jgi:hypothetical protein
MGEDRDSRAALTLAAGECLDAHGVSSGVDPGEPGWEGR